MTVGKTSDCLFKAVGGGFSGSVVGHVDGDAGRSDQLLWFSTGKGERGSGESVEIFTHPYSRKGKLLYFMTEVFLHACDYTVFIIYS